MFQEIEATTVDVLHRHSAPAMPLGQLRALVARERPGFTPPPISMATVIQRMDRSVRMLATDERRLGWMVPVGWIVPPPSPAAPRTLAERLRDSIRRIGHRVEPGSGTALARWARMLQEEARLRPLLSPRRGLETRPYPFRKAGLPGAGPRPSTTRPPHPRPSRRTRAAAGRLASPVPRSGAPRRR